MLGCGACDSIKSVLVEFSLVPTVVTVRNPPLVASIADPYPS
jgi:hypothetical protein